MITSPGGRPSRVTVTTLTVDFSRRASSPLRLCPSQARETDRHDCDGDRHAGDGGEPSVLTRSPAAGPRCLRAVEAPAVDVVLWPPCAGLGAAAGICVDVGSPPCGLCAMARSSSWAERLACARGAARRCACARSRWPCAFPTRLGRFLPLFPPGSFFSSL